MAAIGAALTALLLLAEGRHARNGAYELEARSAPWRNHDHGRAADAPSEIPPAGWKDILLRVYSNIWEHRVLSIAGGVTFYSILAIFPAIAALVSLYGLYADARTVSSTVDHLQGILPAGGIEIVRAQITRIASQSHGALSLSFVVSLVFAIWSANSAMTALFDALNIVYNEKEKRGLVKLYAQALGFTCGALVFGLLAITAVVVLPPALAALDLGNGVEPFIRMARWPLMLAIVALALGVIYRYGPSRERARWRWISWGSAFGAVAWLGTSMLFSWYASNFGRFNATYGSLGAIIGFMMWIWVSAVVILIGGELDAEVEHQTAKDSTTGAP